MKITQIEPAPISFKPVVITLETQEEVDNAYHLLISKQDLCPIGRQASRMLYTYARPLSK